VSPSIAPTIDAESLRPQGCREMRDHGAQHLVMAAVDDRHPPGHHGRVGLRDGLRAHHRQAQDPGPEDADAMLVLVPRGVAEAGPSRCARVVDEEVDAYTTPRDLLGDEPGAAGIRS